jgi:hypothetical protein
MRVVTLCVVVALASAVVGPRDAVATEHDLVTFVAPERVVLGTRVLVPITVDCSGAPEGFEIGVAPVTIEQTTGRELVVSYGGWGDAACGSTPRTMTAVLDSVIRPGPATLAISFSIYSPAEGIVSSDTYEQEILVVPSRSWKAGSRDSRYDLRAHRDAGPRH